jgi:hypothetical protein
LQILLDPVHDRRSFTGWPRFDQKKEFKAATDGGEPLDNVCPLPGQVRNLHTRCRPLAQGCSAGRSFDIGILDAKLLFGRVEQNARGIESILLMDQERSAVSGKERLGVIRV